MIEKKIHPLCRVGVGLSASSIATQVEHAIEKLEAQGWRIQEAGMFQFEGWVFIRMWRETK